MEALLTVEQVTVDYGRLRALDHVEMTLAGGDLVGLIGPNGAGKTTLLRVMAGLQPPTRGRAVVLGEEVLGEATTIRGRIGFAPDSPPAYEELTVEQFLHFIGQAHGLAAAEREERIDYWLEHVWLIDKRRERIKNLSRGMRQRVTLAQTLVPNPTVVLLDEPASGLDPAGRIQLRQVIASLRDQGKAIVVSSHILADLEEYCTHVAILEHGRLLRYAHVGDLHASPDQRCGYRLTVADDGDVQSILSEFDDVDEIEQCNGAVMFRFDMDTRRAADLLVHLVQRGVRVSSFGATRDSFEDVYLKTGVKQVD